jgi:hypothetical protein
LKKRILLEKRVHGGNSGNKHKGTKMARYTPSSDILAILLIQSDYDPDTSLKEVILNVEKYEKTYNRYFITYEGEFRFMFYYMALLRGLITFNDITDSTGRSNKSYYSLDFFENITIRDWIELLLEYEVYESNDSDEMWWERGEEGWFFIDGKHFLLNEKTQKTGASSYLRNDKPPYEVLDHPMTDYVREHLGSNEHIKESAIFDCKLRKFFENPANVNCEKIADFFLKEVKMDILTAWSKSFFKLPTDYLNLRDLPDYIMSSLIDLPSKCDPDWPRLDGLSDKVVFFLIDGLGDDLLGEFDNQHPFLKYFSRDALKTSLTCPFPSSTTSNVTTLHTGLEVANHGIFNLQYYEREVDDIIIPLKFSYAYDKEIETLNVDPYDIFPEETFYKKLTNYGINSTVFQNHAYNDSTYSQKILEGAKIRGYNSLEEGLNDLANCIKRDMGKHYYLFYYDIIDQFSHKHCPRSLEVKDEVNYLLDHIHNFLRKFYLLDEEILFILSSDHGQIDNRGKNVYLNLELPEIVNFIEKSGKGKLLAPAGSPRSMSLYIKEDRLDEALELLREHLYEKAVVHKTEDILEDNDFSRSNSPYRNTIISEKLRSRLGNLLILPVGSWTIWWYEEGVYDVKNKGHHGGLSRDEMIVPFLVWKYTDYGKID